MEPIWSNMGKVWLKHQVHSKCVQILITGHIRDTCYLCSQCVRHLPTRYFGPCPQCQTRICCCAGCYSHAHNMMLAPDLDQELSLRWMQQFWKLNETNICGPGCGLDDKSEGQFVPSWIWLVPHPSPSPTPTSLNNLTMAASSTPNLDNRTMITCNGNTTASDVEVTNSMHICWAKCQAWAE